MLRINRAKAVSRTESGDYGFDYSFVNGLNLISSNKNTRGKSSALLAIYYCLGFEEIIGGRGKKTLTSVYKTVVQDDKDVPHQVLESEVWLEITNGLDTIAIKRTAEMNGRNENLITVYHSSLDDIHSPDVFVEDMYIHSANSTSSSRGFHSFLEQFIGFELPLVPSNDGNDYKLYMQLLFAAFFIEQKRGWSDILSAMPVLNIKDAKKRVLEYLLGLETLTNEKKRASLKIQEASISIRWKQLWEETSSACTKVGCRISGIPMSPRILDGSFQDNIAVVTSEGIAISQAIAEYEEKQEKLSRRTPRIVENFDELQHELEKTEDSIRSLDQTMDSINHDLYLEKSVLKKLEDNLNTISADLRNNKDALKLKRMGSEIGVTSYSGTCPTCGQVIQDSLMPIQNCEHTMSVEENIKHLESQKTMVEFAIKAHRQKIETKEAELKSLSSRIFTLRRLAKTIRSDLFSVDENFSETVVYEKIHIENRIQQLGALQTEIADRTLQFVKLSDEWCCFLREKKSLPRTNFTDSDKEKVDALEINFKEYLRLFNYRSVSSFANIQISRENYLPISEGFDMKFDSSASDNIRAIWAYTLAVLKTSIEKGGNHPQIIIFDEPAQHSIVTADTIALFNEIIKLSSKCQVILGITLNDAEIQAAVRGLAEDSVHLIDVGNHAFVKM